MIHISKGFDSGAIEVVSIAPLSASDATEPAARIHLNLPADNAADFRQWFHFRLHGARGVRCELRFGNCAQSAYPEGWPGYRAVASLDRKNWFRLPTRFVEGELIIEWTPPCDDVYLAYFEPYSSERHLDLLAQVSSSQQARVVRLGSTVEGRDLDLVVVGDEAAHKKRAWVIARQHPGETMAQWFIEGMVARLLSQDEVAQALLASTTFYVVPNMNPDGSARGNLRTNAAGANLNREWLEPCPKRSPEVKHVRHKMHETGVDFFLDVHGDESLPYVFIDGSHMLPGRSPANLAREARFIEAVRAACPDFQTEQGYASDRFTDELYTLASKYVGHTFDCLSVTLEMPFKDNANRPDEATGWSGARSARLGQEMLVAMREDLA
ncbi:MAG: hypothetical protein RIR70_381 [Pseudomonadota bacterium]|jgi:murein tripeptide amidase MpaA